MLEIFTGEMQGQFILSSTPSPYRRVYDGNKAMYQGKFEGSAACDDDEGMCRWKSEDCNVGMYRGKVDTVLLNSRKHIMENIDDCTYTKFIMIGKFNSA